jgi:hypothetical protein
MDFTIGAFLGGALVVAWHKFNTKSKKNVLISIVERDYRVDQILYSIMETLEAQSVFICRFHNGTSYSNGVPMERFSMSNEVVSPSWAPTSGSFQSRLVSEFAGTIQKIVFEHEFMIVPGNAHNEMSNLKFARSISNSDCSIYLKNLSADGIPSAFLGICFSKEKQFTGEVERDYIAQYVPVIRMLVNKQ